MSKQSKAKGEQGYNPRPVPEACSTCEHFTFERFQKHPPTKFQPEGYWTDRNLRCGLGGFAVKKTANCYCHTFKG